jgi:hypothetical protein
LLSWAANPGLIFSQFTSHRFPVTAKSESMGYIIF